MNQFQQSLADASASLKRIWFTTMDYSDPPVPITGSMSFTIRIDFSDGSTAIGGGTITEPDPTHTAGVRYYTPAAADLVVLGQSTVVISADGMQRREVPYDVEARDKYNAMNGGYGAIPNYAPYVTNGLVTVGTGTGQISPDGTTGAVKADVTKYLGTAAATPNTAGLPLVETKLVTTGGITAASFAAAAMTLAKFGTDVLGALGSIAVGTLAAYTAGTPSVTLDTAAPAVANVLINDIVLAYSGPGAGQFKTISAYTSGRVATIDSAFGVTVDATTKYVVLPGSPSAAANNTALLAALAAAHGGGSWVDTGPGGDATAANQATIIAAAAAIKARTDLIPDDPTSTSELADLHGAGSWQTEPVDTVSVIQETYRAAQNSTSLQIPILIGPEDVLDEELAVLVRRPGETAFGAIDAAFGSPAAAAFTLHGNTDWSARWSIAAARANGYTVHITGDSGSGDGVYVTQDNPTEFTLHYETGVSTVTDVQNLEYDISHDYGLLNFSGSSDGATLVAPGDNHTLTLAGGTDGSLMWVDLTEIEGGTLLVTLSDYYLTDLGVGDVQVSYIDEDAQRVYRARFQVVEADAIDVDALIAAINADVHDDTGTAPHPSFLGLKRRLEAWLDGQAINQNGSGETAYFMRNNSTKAFKGTQDVPAGTRGRSDISGSEP